MAKLMQALAALRLKKRPSLYHRLDESRQEIRLIRLLPKDPQIPKDDSKYDVLRCEMRVVSLQDEPIYECISYCWGDAAVTRPFMINGHKLDITTNLEHALQFFRACDKEIVWLWADAICIQQNSVDERNSQVAMMKEIYSRAQRVRAWIKISDADASLDKDSYWENVKSLQAGLSTLPMVDQTPEKLLARGNLAAVRETVKLFRNDYWNRVWILQELAVAKRFRMYYGSHLLSIDDPGWASAFHNGCLASARTLKAFRNQQRQAYLHPDKYPLLWDETLMTISEYDEMMEMLVDIIATIEGLAIGEQLAKASDFDVGRHLLSLRGRQSSRKHDYIYGLLGLAPVGVDIKPDYRISWRALSSHFTYRYIVGMQSLFPLSLAMSGDPDLPSWVVDMASQELFRHSPTLHSELYNAAGESKFKLRLKMPGTITLPGILFEPIRNIAFHGLTISDTGFGQVVSPEQFWTLNCMRLYHSYTAEDGLFPPEGVDYRGLGLVSPDNKQLAADQALVAAGIQPAVLRTLLYDTVNTHDADTQPYSPPRRLDATTLASYKAVIDTALQTDTFTYYEASRLLGSHTDNCSFFMTYDGRVGLANKHIEFGDMICIIASFPTPFIVREYTIRGTKQYLYKFISQCYVDGLMDGEAIKAAADNLGEDVGSIDDLFTDMQFI